MSLLIGIDHETGRGPVLKLNIYGEKPEPSGAYEPKEIISLDGDGAIVFSRDLIDAYEKASKDGEATIEVNKTKVNISREKIVQLFGGLNGYFEMVEAFEASKG